jgi:glycosyltransferase involved in cell wall biosynthesis
MTTLGLTADEVGQNLTQRLTTVSDILLPGDKETAGDLGDLLQQLVAAVQADRSLARVWLLSTAVFGAFPRPDDVVEGVRHLELDHLMEAQLWFLDRGLHDDFRAAAHNRLQIVADRVVVDVDHSARYELHTGIQQVVRRVLPVWDAEHRIEPVVWADRTPGWRPLSPSEQDRVLRTSGNREAQAGHDSTTTLVVPWQTTVVLLEVPPAAACERLSALAQYSGNVVAAVGYDCVPVVSGDLVPPAEPVRFTHFLAALKHTHRIAAISGSALAEFSGFTSGLGAQGLPAPEVVECVLADEPLHQASDRRVTEDADPVSTPEVLSVGSFEPRKNHLALLHAAEVLWREGLTFKLVLIGGSSWGEDVEWRVDQLLARGRPVELHPSVSADEVAAAYRRARFTVFPSVHEGFGLPIVESLGAGTPVIAADYGSAREIAAGGGVMMIDPRDDAALTQAVRNLLTDDALLSTLATQARGRPVRTWHEYAIELWNELVRP